MTGLKRLLTIAAALAFVSSGTVDAQNYPAKTVHIITTDVGGSNDLIARLLADGLSKRLGQSVIVENKAAGVIPNQTVARAAPDGYTLLVTGSSMWMGTLFRDMPYDPQKDFTPVALVAQDANVLVVHPSLPVHSVGELVDYIKARPGQLNYAATSVGGSMHLAAEMFKSMAGLEVVRIGYSGGGQARTDLMAGNVQMAIIGADNAVPLAASGRLRALGVSTLTRSDLVPDLPPISDTLPGYEVVGFTAILAPPGTPKAVVDRLNAEINAVLADPETRKKMIGFNQEPVGGDAVILADKITSDLATWSKLVAEAGLKAQ